MIRERVADDVYIFTSEVYARVNAGAVIGPEWSILIDTLAYPEESIEIRDFIENRLGSPIRYLVNTHYHADHSLGNCWFPNAIHIGHELCRQLLDTRGREALKSAKDHNRDLAEVEIVLPDITFEDGGLALRTGKRTLMLFSLPGHSVDGIGVLLVEDKILFSGDIMMPLPYLIDGDLDTMVQSLKQIPKLKLENLVQGHGELILRGEIPIVVKSNLDYISKIRSYAKKALRRKNPEEFLAAVNIEDCGKNRVLLNGLAAELHHRNLLALYQRYRKERDG